MPDTLTESLHPFSALCGVVEPLALPITLKYVGAALHGPAQLNIASRTSSARHKPRWDSTSSHKYISVRQP